MLHEKQVKKQMMNILLGIAVTLIIALSLILCGIYIISRKKRQSDSIATNATAATFNDVQHQQKQAAMFNDYEKNSSEMQKGVNRQANSNFQSKQTTNSLTTNLQSATSQAR